MKDVSLSVVESVDFSLVNVESDDGEPAVTNCSDQRQADVSQADDRNRCGLALDLLHKGASGVAENRGSR